MPVCFHVPVIAMPVCCRQSARPIAHAMPCLNAMNYSRYFALLIFLLKEEKKHLHPTLALKNENVIPTPSGSGLRAWVLFSLVHTATSHLHGPRFLLRAKWPKLLGFGKDVSNITKTSRCTSAIHEVFGETGVAVGWVLLHWG